ncbi:hypothetical protein, partial [Mesorhizobium sp.]
IGERHRRFSAVMKAEVRALAAHPMPVRRAVPAMSELATYRAPANEPQAMAGSSLYRNRTGVRP